MPGQCYACGAEFGLFKKEKGCKNCGFAFCSRCLTKKAAIPKEKLDSRHKSEGSDKETHHVCNKCYNILTGKAKPEESGRRTPPEALLKRMAALEQKEASGASHGSHPKGASGKAHAKYATPEKEIAERLEKLKDKPKEPKVSDKDLNERLARLKGENPAVRTAPTKPFYQPPDRRTQVEQIDDLLDEIANEVEIDSHRPDPASDVENRLSRLRDDQTGEVRKDEQNNLDKNDAMPQKKFVKNIDVGNGGSTRAAGQEGKPGEDKDLDFEEVQALMARAAVEMEEDAQRALQGMQKDKELMERLAEIKQRQKKKGGQADEQSLESNVDNTQQDDEDSEDEETAARKIMQQFLEEAKLDEQVGDALASGPGEPTASKAKTKAGKSKGNGKDTGGKPQKETNIGKGATADDDSDYEDPDELPYCIICTEDAVIRCIDCDMDLYCNRCFKEGHKELGLTDHRSVPYKAPKGYR